MNYEELFQEVTRIKKELEEIGVGPEVDGITIEVLHCYLQHAMINLLGILCFLECKIKEQEGEKK